MEALLGLWEGSVNILSDRLLHEQEKEEHVSERLAISSSYASEVSDTLVGEWDVVSHGESQTQKKWEKQVHKR